MILPLFFRSNVCVHAVKFPVIRFSAYTVPGTCVYFCSGWSLKDTNAMPVNKISGCLTKSDSSSLSQKSSIPPGF